MSEPQEVADILDGLTDPTADEVYQAVREYDTRDVVAAVGSKADAAGGGGGGSGPVLTASVTLDNAAIKALPTTPVAIIPTVGAANKIIALGGAVMLHLAVDYTNVGVNCGMALGNADGGAPYGDSMELSGNINDGFAPDDAHWPQFSLLASGGFVGEAEISGDRHRQMWLSAYNQDEAFSDLGNFTGGDAANSMLVTVYYAVVEFP